jgi:hypothetical protein
VVFKVGIALFQMKPILFAITLQLLRGRHVCIGHHMPGLLLREHASLIKCVLTVKNNTSVKFKGRYFEIMMLCASECEWNALYFSSNPYFMSHSHVLS